MLHQQHFQGASLYTAEGSRKYLTPAERERFMAAARACPRPDLRTLCLTLAYTGCRISEALALTAGAVEIEGGFIVFRTLKRRHGAMVFREVPVPDALLLELRAVHGIGTCDPTERLWRLCRSRAWALVKGVMQEAGIRPGKHATPKGLRHSFGLQGVRTGIALSMIQKWLGHARLESSIVYTQAMGVEEREIARRLWQSDRGDCHMAGGSGLACEVSHVAACPCGRKPTATLSGTCRAASAVLILHASAAPSSRPPGTDWS